MVGRSKQRRRANSHTRVVSLTLAPFRNCALILDHVSLDTPVQPLSLMRYFKPSATASNARELSSKAFDVAFWPFTDLALPKTDLDSDESDKDSEDDDDLFSDDDFNDKSRGKGKGKGKTVPEKAKKEEEEVKFEGGMSLEEKKQVGIRLLCLASTEFLVASAWSRPDEPGGL